MISSIRKIPSPELDPVPIPLPYPEPLASILLDSIVMLSILNRSLSFDEDAVPNPVDPDTETVELTNRSDRQKPPPPTPEPKPGPPAPP
jgi:hypothetical protein